MDMQPPKGMRDFPPEEQLFRQDILARLRSLFERYGFDPLETPIVERFDVLSAKYAGGAEILKETFRLKDQGGRELGLRYDLTVPLARFIASNPNVKLPFKRYAIAQVYRDGPIKLGRYREFYQCDCDTVGADSALADAECLLLAHDVFSALDLASVTATNHIGLLKAMLRHHEIPEEHLERAMLTLDKLKKIGKEGVEAELRGHGIEPGALGPLLSLSSLATNEEKLSSIEKVYGNIEGLERMREVLSLAPRAKFDPSLARGLAYYTGIVFETFLESSEVASSVSGGGRYDRMIGGFLSREDEFPAVGISFGLEPIMDAIRGRERKSTVTKVFVIPIKTLQAALELVQDLRAQGIPTEIDLLGRGVSKNLEYANAKRIPHTIVLGQRELDEGKVTLKDMASGAERLVPRDEIIALLT